MHEIYLINSAYPLLWQTGDRDREEIPKVKLILFVKGFRRNSKSANLKSFLWDLNPFIIE